MHSTKLLTKYSKKFYLKIFFFICEYLREFSKKFEMVLMGYSGIQGTLIYEKNLKAKISCQTPFKWVIAKFGTCTVVSVNGTLVEDTMRRFTGECAHFIFNKCPIYIHDGASAKFSTNSHETDNSVPL